MNFHRGEIRKPLRYLRREEVMVFSIGKRRGEILDIFHRGKKINRGGRLAGGKISTTILEKGK